ncbi:MAG: glycosyltransferase family 4 protein [Betaproteobacteria bacterium]|nr:glycosyltransferase family 4 protein [Betaproteobacteria bacterium]
MKIALARASYNPFGGAERTIQSVAEAMRAGGDEPTLLTRHWPDNAGHGIAHQVVNPRYFSKAGREKSFANAVGRIIDARAFDLVQSYERIPGAHVYHAVDGVHAEWLERRKRGQNLMGRLGVILNPHHRAVLDLERRMYASPTLKAVICISQMVKDDIVRRFGVDAERCEVIHLDIDSEKFHPRVQGEFRAATRSALGIPSSAPVVVFAGSGFVRKGVAAFLQALFLLPDAHGIVVGHDKALSQFRAMAIALGVGGRAHFTGGVKDVRPYYGAADVFLMPTLYEPFGLVYGEAMACGLPAIVSRDAGAQDWIVEGKNGYVVDPMDIGAMARAVEAALANPGMREAARESVLPYTAATAALKYRALYQRLGARRAPGP